MASPLFSAPALLAGFATAGLALYALAGGRQLALAAHVYLSCLAALAALALGGRVLRGRAGPADPPGLRSWLPSLRRRPRQAPLRSLEELEHAVDFSLATAFDVHFRLRPHLAAIAEHRLAARGVSLELQPERARDLLGEEAYELVRPGRRGPEDRNASGLDLDALTRIVRALEAV